MNSPDTTHFVPHTFFLKLDSSVWQYPLSYSSPPLMFGASRPCWAVSSQHWLMIPSCGVVTFWGKAQDSPYSPSPHSIYPTHPYSFVSIFDFIFPDIFAGSAISPDSFFPCGAISWLQSHEKSPNGTCLRFSHPLTVPSPMGVAGVTFSSAADTPR